MTDNVGGLIPVSPILPEQPPQETVEVLHHLAAEQEKIVIDWDLPDRHVLAQRANSLAPVLWNLSFATYGTTWNEALQNPSMRDGMLRCYSFAEIVVRLIDVMTEYKK